MSTSTCAKGVRAIGVNRHLLDELGDHLRGFGADALVIQRGPQVAHPCFKTLQQYPVRKDVGGRCWLRLYGELGFESGFFILALHKKALKSRAEHTLQQVAFKIGELCHDCLEALLGRCAAPLSFAREARRFINASIRLGPS